MLMLSVAIAVVAWFLPGEQVIYRGYEKHSIGSMLSAVLFGLAPDISWSLRNVVIAKLAALILIGLNLLGAGFCARWLAKSQLLKWIWIATSVGFVATMILGWWRGQIAYFIVGFPPYQEPQHLRFLMGFHFSCAAIFLHLLGLALIPSLRGGDTIRPEQSSA
ncbi:MAG: hypothetical protein QM755_20140 [Luteolibacter sp.]